jgi:hypothetical protein
MWEIFRETDQLPLQLPARATVCRPVLLCLLFGEEVAAAFPCGVSSRWLVRWQIDCAGRPKEKLREWSEREEIDEGFLCPAQLDGPGRTWSRFRGSSAVR